MNPLAVTTVSKGPLRRRVGSTSSSPRSGAAAGPAVSRNEERPYKCEQCPKNFKNSVGLWHHKKNVHSVKKHRCNVCNKKFVKKDHLTQHLRVHSGEKPFECDQCGKRFGQRGVLNRHKKEVHPRDAEEAKKTCVLYKKVFKNEGSLKKHHELHRRLRVKSKQCVFCDAKYYTKRCLDNHLRAHIGEKPYSCDGCELSFIRMVNLKNHRRLMHGNPETKYQCRRCPGAFYLRALLDSHMRTVHDVWPGDKNRCLFCGIGWNSNCLLEDHMRTHTRERPYNCKSCDRSYVSTTSRLFHSRRKHPEDMEARCDLCGREYYSARDLTRHTRKVHGKE